MISNTAYAHESAWVDDGVEIGDESKIWHFVHVLGGTKTGQNCVLGQNVMAGPNVVVGESCKVQNNVALYKDVTLEQDVFCGPSAVFTNVLSPRAHVERKDEFGETLVKRGATIGWVCKSGDRLGADLVCPRTGEHYVETDNVLNLVEA